MTAAGKKKARAVGVAVVVFLLFLVAGWFVPGALALAGSRLWILRAGLWVLGLVASGLLLYYLWPRARAAESPQAGVEDLDAVFAAARARLAQARAGKGARIGKRPLLLVLGPAGGAKTTIVTRSGLEPELLGGEVHRGEEVVRTDPANVWLAGDTLIVEAGGRLLQDDARWQRLVHRIRPDRVAAAFARGEQAPRTAVVCFPCDELLRPGASESVPAAGRRLRARLEEVSQALGIRLPVYVVFTKADRLPYFGDYVRSFSREEAREVLGATLPLADPAAAGAYAERESARLAGAFDGLYRSLALHRIDVLSRENADDLKAGDYEFPREFLKVSNLAVQFMVDLCRPSQLGTSPFVRGFYFTGVRPIVIHDTGTAAAAPAAPAAAPEIGATSVFDAAALRAAAAARQQSAPAGTSRRVPEWTFLPRIFSDVVLRDRVAMGLTGGGARVNLLRRGLLAAAALVGLIFAGGFTVSYFGNRALERDVVAGAHAAAAVPATVADPPPAEALLALDSLRAQAARLSAGVHGGRPWRLGWGLYRGAALYPLARSLYFREFRRLVWQDGRGQLVGSLRALPEQPSQTSEYGGIYDALKAYLITTDHGAESTPEFLTPVLLRYWQAGASADDARLGLVRGQFDFFATELPYGDPYGDAPDSAAISRARSLLLKFGDADRLYQAMVTQADQAAPPVQFDKAVPNAGGVVRNQYVVPGAFTKPGWTFVQDNLSHLDRFFSRETWVLGETPVTAQDRAKLAAQLRTHYVTDYISHWQHFLAAGAVAGFGGAADAAQKLARLGDNQSPLLHLLALASTNTAVGDTVSVGPAFQPVQSVVAPNAPRYVDKPNQQYMAALVGLQTAMGQVSSASGPARDQALQDAAAQAQQAHSAVQQMAQGFDINGDARAVGDAVQRLLQAPITAADGVINRLPSAAVDASGRSFCRSFGVLDAKYPFSAHAAAEASPDEVTAVLQPGSSALWSFYNDALQGLLVPQGRAYAPKPGATPQPTSAFVAFFNRAAALSHTLYDDAGNGPRVGFTLRPQTTPELPEITVNIDGNVGKVTRTLAASHTYTWNGQTARTARITAQVGGSEVTLLDARPGTWALFHLFETASWKSTGGGRYLVTWSLPDQHTTLTAELSFAGGLPIFSRDYLDQFRCVSDVAR